MKLSARRKKEKRNKNKLYNKERRGIIRKEEVKIMAKLISLIAILVVIIIVVTVFQLKKRK